MGSGELGALLYSGETPVALCVFPLVKQLHITFLCDICVFFALRNKPTRKRDGAPTRTTELS